MRLVNLKYLALEFRLEGSGLKFGGLGLSP